MFEKLIFLPNISNIVKSTFYLIYSQYTIVYHFNNNTLSSFLLEVCHSQKNARQMVLFRLQNTAWQKY